MNVPVDRRGKHLTPGERFLNWCKGAVMVWPIIVPLLGGAIYGNSQTVKDIIHGPQLPDGELADLEVNDTQAVIINAINNKLKKHDAALASLKKLSEQGDTNLEQRVLKLESLVQ